MLHFKNFFWLFLLFSACAFSHENELPNNWEELIGENSIYKIGVPPGFEIGKHAVLDEIQGPGFYADGISVNIYEPSYKYLSTSCPFLSGVSDNTALNFSNPKAKWGKVNFFDNIKLGDFPTDDEKPLCNPFYAEATSYAFCAQRDGRTIVICINQMKDDPEMAKQIFESFRWTE